MDNECSLEFHHLGIVVRDIEVAANCYLHITNLKLPIEVERVNSCNVDICFIPLGKGKIEFLEPINSNSPVVEFLKKGGGLHHICFESENFDKTLNNLKKFGRVLGRPVIGFEKRRSVFLYLKQDTLGMRLVELAEKQLDKSIGE